MRMLKVTIEVNGVTIGEGTAVNKGHPGKVITDNESTRVYELHDGEIVVHDRENGVAPLAKRVVDYIDFEEE